LFEPKEVEFSPVINESIAMALEPARTKGIEILTSNPRNLRVLQIAVYFRQ
jgi:hypothetical protein